MSRPDSSELEELRQELHRANEAFHRCRQEWEHWMGASEYRHDERIADARAKLQDAEHKVEEIEDRIRRRLQSG